MPWQTPSVRTGSLVDASSDNSYDVDEAALLAAAGVSSGDTLSVFPITIAETRRLFFTDTSLTLKQNLLSARLTWDKIVPSGAQGRALFEINVQPGTDETCHVQLYNAVNDEVIVEQDNITTNTNVSVGWSDYTPTTTASPIVIAPRIETDPGSNSSIVNDPTAAIGVQL